MSRLTDLFSRSKRPAKGRENRRSVKPIFFCLAGAAVIWTFSALNKDYTTVVNYPVTFVYENPNDSLLVVEPLPTSIKYEVFGKGWNLLSHSMWLFQKPLRLTLEDPVATNMIGASMWLSEGKLQMPDVNVLRALDDSTLVQVEPRTSKKIKLELPVDSLRIESNYELSSAIALQPREIEVWGPASKIKKLRSTLVISWPPLSEDAIEETTETRFPVADILPAGINSDTEEMYVRFAVDKLVDAALQVSVRAIVRANVGIGADEIKTDPETVRVLYQVRQSQGASVLPDEFEVGALITQQFFDKGIAPLALRSKPSFVRNARIEIDTVKLVKSQ